MAYRIDPEIRIFSVDTGRLPAETHELIAQLRDRYPGLDLEVLAPEEEHVRRMVERKGLDLFRESVENRLLCCNVRKVRPLARPLATLDAWITGLRAWRGAASAVGPCGRCSRGGGSPPTRETGRAPSSRPCGGRAPPPVRGPRDPGRGSGRAAARSARAAPIGRALRRRGAVGSR